MFLRVIMMIAGFTLIYMAVGDVELLDILIVSVGGLAIAMSQHIED